MLSCGLVNLPKDILVVVDSELENSQGMVCGGNEDNFHFINVDLKVIENIKYFDLIAVKEEDTCACCGGKHLTKNERKVEKRKSIYC